MPTISSENEKNKKNDGKTCKSPINFLPLHPQFAKDRDLAQLVAHTSGGREVAGSSPVIPTFKKANRLIKQLAFFLLFIHNRLFQILVITHQHLLYLTDVDGVVVALWIALVNRLLIDDATLLDFCGIHFLADEYQLGFLEID